MRKIPTDISTLTELVQQGLQIRDIAEKLAMSKGTVRKRMKEHGLKSCHKLKMTEEQRKKMSVARLKWNKENPEKLSQLMTKRAKNRSVPCERLKKWLETKNIAFAGEYPPLLHKNRAFSIDVAFPDKMVGIEVNGNQHYYPDGSLRPRYQERHDLIENEGWKLYEIYYPICFKDEELEKMVSLIMSSPIKATFDYGAYRPRTKKMPVNKYAKGDHSWRRLPRHETRRCVWPSKNDLEKLVWEKPRFQLAKVFGVSDVAIKSWCKKYGITNLPSRGYWARRHAGQTHDEALAAASTKMVQSTGLEPA